MPPVVVEFSGRILGHGDCSTGLNAATEFNDGPRLLRRGILPYDTIYIGPFARDHFELCSVRIAADNELDRETYNCISGL